VIEDWGISAAEYRRWRETCSNPKETVDHIIADLKPNTTYAVQRDGKPFASVRSNASGEIRLRHSGGQAIAHTFEVKR
jgi:hypothetical protein